jgi:hypothetical protein
MALDTEVQKGMKFTTREGNKLLIKDIFENLGLIRVEHNVRGKGIWDYDYTKNDVYRRIELNWWTLEE